MVSGRLHTFMQASRLNILRGLEAKRDDPELTAAMAMIVEHREAALDSLRRLTAVQDRATAQIEPDDDPDNKLRLSRRE